MKRLLILLLTVLMAICCVFAVACGSNGNNDGNNDTNVDDNIEDDNQDDNDDGDNDTNVDDNIEDDNQDDNDDGGIVLPQNNSELEYVLINDGTEYEVSGYSGYGVNLHIAVPQQYQGKTVTSIGDYAFLSRAMITKITLPDTITNIGDYAFGFCEYLTQVNIPDGVTSIGESAFMGCFSLTEITIPMSVANIGESAFSSCVALTTYCERSEKPSGWLCHFEGAIVWDCKNNSVANDGYIYTVVDGIRYGIKDGEATVVTQSTTITMVNIPKSINYAGENYAVTSIGMFSPSITSYISFTKNGVADKFSRRISCQSLVSVTIPDSITSISYGAFNCIEDTVTIYCESKSKPDGWDRSWNSGDGMPTHPVVWDYKNNSVADDGYIYTVVDGVRYSLKDGKATVERQAQTLTTANIVSSIDYNGETYQVTQMNQVAFYGCSYLSSVIIPKTVTSIKPASTYQVRPNSYEDCPFMGCPNVIVYFEAESEPEDWANYSGDNSIYGWEWRLATYISTASEYLSYCTVVWDYKNNKVAENGYIPVVVDGVKYGIKDGEATVLPQVKAVFPTASRLQSSVIIKSSIVYENKTYSVTSISDYAFDLFSWIESIEIPKSIKSIGNSAFSECYSLSSVTFEDGSNLKTIGEAAFSGYYQGNKIKSIEIPDGVTTIGLRAFGSCSSLISIVIPESVVNLDYAFAGCRALTIYCEAKSKPGGWVDDLSGVGLPIPIVWDYKNNEVAEDGCLYTVIDNLKFALKDGEANLTVFISWEEEIVSLKIPDKITYKGETYIVTSIAPSVVFDETLIRLVIPKTITSLNCSFMFCTSLTIYCEVSCKPDNWSSNWNSNGYGSCPVIWDYKG